MTAFQIYALTLVIIYIVYYVIAIGWELQHPHLMYSPENAFGFSTRYVKEIDNCTYCLTDGTETDDDGVSETDYDDLINEGVFDQPEIETVDEAPEEEPPLMEDDSEIDEDYFETYEKIRQVQEDNPSFCPEFNEQYDASEFAVVMNQPPDVNRKILRETMRY